MVVINTLAPIVLIVALGAALGHSGFLPDPFVRRANRLVYWVGIPCLLFVKTAQPIDDLGPALRLFAVLAAGMCACTVCGCAVALLLNVPRRSVGTFVQGAYRGNLVYVGLPVILFALSGLNNGEVPPGAEALAILAIAPLVPLYNALAVAVLLAGTHGPEATVAKRLRRLAISTVTNPLIVACVAGLAWAWTRWPLPAAAARAVATLGQMSLPLALLSLGAGLHPRRLRGHWLPCSAAAAIKLGVGPLTGALCGMALGLGAVELRVALLYLACPTAVLSYVMVCELGGDEELAAGIVVVTTLASVVALAAVLLLV